MGLEVTADMFTVTGPEERFRTDPAFKMLVSMFESMIWKAEFTPSEIREAAMLACIHREEQRFWARPFPPRIETRSTAARLGNPPPALIIVDGFTYERSTEP